MKATWRRYIALVLAITLVISCGVFSSDRFLRATDSLESGEDAQGTEWSEDASETVGEVTVIEQGTLETEEAEETEETQVSESESESKDNTEKVDSGVDMPAAVVTAKAEDGAVITVDAPKGALPAGFTVIAKTVAVEESLVEQALEDQIVESVLAYDITIYDKEGNEIQPGDAVKVKIDPAVDLSGESGVIAHVSDNNKLDQIEEVDNLDKAVIESDHFSIYVIAVTKDSQINTFYNQKVDLDVYTGSNKTEWWGGTVWHGTDSHNWSVSVKDIVELTTKENGTKASFTAKKTGTVKITHKYRDTYNWKTYSETWTVSISEEKVEVERTSIRVNQGYAISVNTKNLKPSDIGVTWSANNSNVSVTGDSSKVTITGLKEGTAKVTGTTTHGATVDIEVTVLAADDTFDVAVYATNGSKDGLNPEMERLLGLNSRQDDGYYAIGAITLPTMLKDTYVGSGKKAGYITSEEEWNIIESAINSTIDTNPLNEGINKNNVVALNLDKVQHDIGALNNSQKTALVTQDTAPSFREEFYYTYKFHLDLRFATNTCTFVGVMKNGKTVDLGTRTYLNNTITKVPGTSSDWYLSNVPDRTYIAGYYADKSLKTEYSFGGKLSADTTIYVKLLEGDINVSYDLGGGTTTSEQTSWTKLIVGDNMPTVLNPVREGFIFKGWKVEGSNPEVVYSGCQDASFPRQVTKSVKYVAIWEEKTATISYNTSEGGSVTRTEETFNTVTGTIKGSEAKPDEGYEFVGWSKDGGQTISSTDKVLVPSDVSSDTTYVAVFKKKLIPVAVYATSGSKDGVSPKLEELLGLKYKQDDGYYPIGVIYVSASLLEGKTSPYIKTEADFQEVMSAFSDIDKSTLANDGEKNNGNTVASHLDRVQMDLGQNSGSQKTALFDWPYGGEAYSAIAYPESGKNFKYHLDLRFATNVISYTGVYQQNDGSLKTGKEGELGQYAYLTGENTAEPGKEDADWFINLSDSEKKIYTVEGYYTDSACTTEYVFGNPISEDTQVYVKFKRGTNTISYNTNGGTTTSDKTSFENVYTGSDTPKIEEPTMPGYDFTGWKDGDGNVYESNDDLPPTVTSTVEYTAQWKEKEKVTISYVSNNTELGTVSVPSEKLNVEIGVASGSEAIVAEGCHFVGWYDENGKLVSTDLKLVPTKPAGDWKAAEYTAIFEKNYKLVISAGSEEAEFDGGSHSAIGYELEGLREEDTVTGVVVNTVTKTDAGTYPTSIDDKSVIVIKDSTGRDITDWYEIEKEDGSLVINKRKVVIASASDTKVYDGSPLVRNNPETDISFPGKAFVGTDGATYTITGKATEPGKTVKNTFSYVLNQGVKASNYDIETVEGDLTITDENVSFDITLVAKSDTRLYNGAQQTVEGLYVSGFAGTEFKIGDADFTISGATASASGKDYSADGYTSVVDKTNAVITDAQGNDVTKYFNIKTENGRLDIVRRTINLQSFDKEEKYTGKAVTNDKLVQSGNGFVEGEAPVILVTGSQTLVGESANTIEVYFSEAVNQANYIINKTEGKLKVTGREADDKLSITVTANSNSGEYKYDGTAKTVEGLTGTTVTIDGVQYRVEGLSASRTETNAGSYTVEVTGTAHVYDADNNDVTDQFTVNTVAGSLVIDKRTVSFLSASAEKQYDGKVLSANNPETDMIISGDGVIEGDLEAIIITGSQLTVGSSKNAYSLTWKQGAKDNYEITENAGTLNVTNRNAKYEITVAANSSTDNKYDGTEFSVSGVYVKNSETANLAVIDGVSYTVSGLYTEEAKRTAAGQTTVNVTGKAKVVDAAGNDVSDQFIVHTESGVLAVAKRDIELTSASGEKKYDGTPLVKNQQTDVTVGGDGLAQGESLVYVITGKQTIPGTSYNEFSYAAGENTSLDNYNVTLKTEGTLHVIAPEAVYEIQLTPKSDNKTYDGSLQSVEGLVTNEFRHNNVSYFVSGVEAKAEGTNAGSYQVKVDDSNLVIKNAAGEDVTKLFDVKFGAASLEIAKRIVTLSSSDGSKVYDGEPLVKNAQEDITVTDGSFVDGELKEYSITGTRTLPGTAENSFDLVWAKDVAANYTINKNYGTLTVRDRDESEPLHEFTVVANSSTGNKYDGTEKTVNGITGDTWTNNGHTYTVTGLSASRSETNAGTYTVEVTGTAKVVDENNNDVTKQFKVSRVSGSLEIAKRALTIASATDWKYYDGTALTNTEISITGDGFAEGEGASYKVSGSATAPGEVKNNEFTYTLNQNTNADNYNITVKVGTLTVKSRPEDSRFKMIVETTGATYKYDGKAHTAGGIVNTVFTAEGVSYTLSGVEASTTAVDAGTYPVNITGTAVVTDSNGNVVTDQFDITYVNKELVINPRTVLITSATAQKAFDGSALTAKTVEISEDGFAEGEGASYEFTGEQTYVGISPNYFDYELVNANPDNYEIEKVYGSLNVTSRGSEESPLYQVTLVANSDEVIYNGHEQSVTGFETTSFDIDGNTYEVSGLEAVAKGTEASVYPTEISGTALVTDESGQDVSDQFEVKVVAGSLTIKGVHTLTINYIDEEHNTLAPSYVEKVVVGEKYGPITSPEVEGYVPVYKTIVSDEAGMPDHDLVIDVVYIREDDGNHEEDDPIITPDQPDDNIPDDDPEDDDVENIDDNDNNDNNDNNDGNDDNNDNNDNNNNDNNDVVNDDVNKTGQVSVDEDGNAVIKDIEDDEVPLISGDNGGAWALINLILMIVTIIVSLVLLITYFIKKKDEKEDESETEKTEADRDNEEETKRHGLIRILSIIPAVAAVIAFILTEDMSLPMTMLDRWTLLMFIILIVELILAVLSTKTKSEKEEEQEA